MHKSFLKFKICHNKELQQIRNKYRIILTKLDFQDHQALPCSCRWWEEQGDDLYAWLPWISFICRFLICLWHSQKNVWRLPFIHGRFLRNENNPAPHAVLTETPALIFFRQVLAPSTTWLLLVTGTLTVSINTQTSLISETLTAKRMKERSKLVLSNAKKLNVVHHKSLLRDARTTSTVHVAGFGTHQETEAHPLLCSHCRHPQGLWTDGETSSEHRWYRPEPERRTGTEHDS